MILNVNNYSEILGDSFKVLSEGKKSPNEDVVGSFTHLLEVIQSVREGGDALKKSGEVLKIGVVGQVKAGKSSFLNSLFFDGESVLPKASTPMTAGLTILEHGSSNEFEVEYYSEAEWNSFKKKADNLKQTLAKYRADFPDEADSTDDEILQELKSVSDEELSARELVMNFCDAIANKIGKESVREKKSFKNIQDLQKVLAEYVGAHGKYTSIVKSLTIRLNDPRLVNLCIVDTPGVNDPVVSREMCTRRFLKECHGVFLLSSASHFFDGTDVDFLTNRIGTEGISKVLLIASKLDSALQDQGVNEMFYDKLDSSVEEVHKVLENQFSRNFEKSEFKGEKPDFTMSSGIGFSIYKKDRNQWDSVEQNAVEQMQALYPSDFCSDEKIKETFNWLSQMEDIRKEYLDGVFLKKKDEIIARKVDQYFDNSEKGLTEQVNNEFQFLDEKCKMLKTVGMAQLKAMRDNTSALITEFGQMMDELSAECEKMAGQALRECLNNLREPTVRIPTYTETVYAERGGTIMGSWNKHDVACSCRMVDVYAVAESVSNQVEKSAHSASRNWMRETDKIVREMKQRLKNKVAEAEEKCPENCVPGADLRRAIDEAVTEMTDSREVDLSYIACEIAEEVESVASSNQPNFPSYLGSMSEVEAKAELRDIANDAVDSVRSEVVNLVSDFSPRVEAELEEAKNNFVEVFGEHKDELTDSIESAMQTALDNFEEQLKDRERQIKELEVAISVVGEVKKKMKI